MEAEKHLRAALNADRRMAEAAYNLGVLLAEDRPDAGEIYLRQGKPERPSAVYLQALKKKAHSDSDLERVGAKLRALAAEKRRK